ncbi:hypothetical protein CsSME_00015809 [Camellia sinensis var. sinensis]
MNDWSTIAFWQHDLHKFVAFGAHDFPTLVGRARNFSFPLWPCICFRTRYKSFVATREAVVTI